VFGVTDDACRVAGHSWVVKKVFDVDVYEENGKTD